MTKSELEKKVRKFCGNMIYIFIEDSLLQTTKYFGKYTSRIKAKKEAQRKYITGLTVVAQMGSNGLSEVYEWIKDEIKKTYPSLYNPSTNKYEPATPNLILYHLSQGEEINGINWSDGVYGIGATKTNSFGDGVTVDPTTGDFYDSGTYMGKGTPVVGKKSIKTLSLYDADNNVTYTAKLKNGAYYAYSYSNEEGVTKVSSGTKITALDSTFWDNINNMLVKVTELVNSFASMLSGESATSLSPAQISDGWYEEKDDTLQTALLLGAGVLVTGIVLNNNKKSGKKFKNK